MVGCTIVRAYFFAVSCPYVVLYDCFFPVWDLFGSLVFVLSVLFGQLLLGLEESVDGG